MKQFSKLAIPYFVWLLILVVLPLVVMFCLTFMSTNGMDFSDAELTAWTAYYYVLPYIL